MMRARWRSPVLLTAVGMLLLGGACASVTVALESTDVGSAQAAGRPLVRSWDLTLSPAPDDLALAEMSFPRGRLGSVSAASLRLAVSGPFGDDYLAAATPLARGSAGPRALVVLVNRPSPLLDPAAVHIRVTTWRRLGAAVVWRLTDPFMRTVAGATPALCNLPLRGTTLSASDLRPLFARGVALTDIDAASAVAVAYDVACGLSYKSAFALAVTDAATPGPQPPVVPQPSPIPEPEVPGLQCQREHRPRVVCPA
jgi:hypothetical protein